MSRYLKALLVGLFVFLLGLPAAALTFAPAALPLPAEANPTPTPAPVTERDYVLGISGADVYAFKQRLQVLGYFRQTVDLSSKISETTLERVNQLLSDHGMEPVETITPEIQAMIFTRDDLAIIPTPTPKPTPLPFLMPVGTPALPALDSEGFLADTADAYTFADAEDGLWYYITDTLYINIRHYNDQENENIWLECEVKTRGDERMLSFRSTPTHVYQTPVALARANHAVLAFTDDFFVKRGYGIIIRNAEILRNKIRTQSISYPIGDTLAVLADGRMLAFDYNAYSAKDYLAMNAEHVLSFGPWLVHNGALNPRITEGNYMPYHEPRCALGMIEPGHYVIIAVDGRYSGADGALFTWLAQRMQAMGVTEALNLDGGGTVALVFMGTQLSRVSNARPDGGNTRRVSSMMGFGIAEGMPE